MLAQPTLWKRIGFNFLKKSLNRNLNQKLNSHIQNFLKALNPFLANVSILSPLKKPENQWFPSVFKGYEMRTLARNALMYFVYVLRSTTFADQKIPKNVAIFYDPPSLNINVYTFFESVALR